MIFDIQYLSGSLLFLSSSSQKEKKICFDSNFYLAEAILWQKQKTKIKAKTKRKEKDKKKKEKKEPNKPQNKKNPTPPQKKHKNITNQPTNQQTKKKHKEKVNWSLIDLLVCCVNRQNTYEQGHMMKRSRAVPVIIRSGETLDQNLNHF